MRVLRNGTLALVLLLAVTGGGCSTIKGWFGGGAAEPAQPPPTPQAEAGQAPAQAEQGPFAAGVLNTIVQRAPAGSASQLLAQLAAGFGWEEQVASHPALQGAVLEGRFAERVEPILLGLYFRNGFSVLPVVGEGHQFNRDTVVQGALGSSRLLVSNREQIRIVFLRPVQNVEIVYYQDGIEPQVFSVSDQAVVAVRQSLSRLYLR
jgi:hypothetical protein